MSRELSASARDHLERLIYRFGGHQEARFDRAAAKLGHLHRPDFIIIGAPKCGTSWLQRALAQHPNIVMVPDEIEYFSCILTFRSSGISTISFAGLQIGGRNGLGTVALIGEKSARYCSIELDRIGMMHRLLPDARLS